MSSSKLHRILTLLKISNDTKNLDQIFSQVITSGLVYVIPSWNCIIRAYSKSILPIKGIQIYNYFYKGSPISLPADNCTYPSVLQACTRIFSLAKGTELHAHVVKIGLHSDLYVQNALVHFYGHLGQVSHARFLFDEMPKRDIASWNTLLGVYNASAASWIEVLFLFRELVRDGVNADVISFVIVLSTCGRVGAIAFGRSVHGYMMKSGIGCHLKVENALLDMYAKCKETDEALRLFKDMSSRSDVVSHTIMINGYVAKGMMDLAREVFNMNIDKDLVLWNSMIHAYVKAKRPGEALELFSKMESEGLMPDENTLVDLLSACAELGDLIYGRLIHRYIVRNNIRRDVFVGTALIYMYSKCGSLEEAMVTFYKMGYKDVYTWTAVIEGLANYGLGNQALSLFKEMEKQGIEPNEATFLSVLTACSHSGLVSEGCQLFCKMVDVYKIKPQIKHFCCLVDILSRAGILEQAELYINSMQPGKRLVANKALLSACITYSKLDLGWKVATEIKKLDSHSYATHVLLSNFYALAGQWAEVAESRRIVKEFITRKEPGVSLAKVAKPQ